MKKFLHFLIAGFLLGAPALKAAKPPQAVFGSALNPSGAFRYLNVDINGALILAGVGFTGSSTSPQQVFGTAVDPNGNFQYLKVDSNGGLIVSGLTNGTVTSVSFTGDGTLFSSTPSTPITVSGTLTPTLLTQSANRFLAGPASGAAAVPGFRAITTPDLPNFPVLGTESGGTAYGVTSPTTFYFTAVTIQANAGQNSDLAVINFTFPPGMSHWYIPNGGSPGGAYAVTAAGTLAGALLTVRDAISNGGQGMTGSGSWGMPASAGAMTQANGVSGVVSATTTLVLRQNANSVNAGTVSFSILVYWLP